MIVSTCQPYFAPYPGFFSKILRSDAVVVMDAVQFPLGTTWLTRNRFKGHQGTMWMSVPVWKKGRGLQIIGDVKICYDGQWARKYLTSLKTVYKHAPFFEDHVPFLENIFSKNFERLLDLNTAIISYLMKHLDISTEMLLLSELDIETKEPQLTVEICKKIGASHFMAQRSAGKYLDQKALQNEKIKLELFTPRSVTYPQLWGPFIPNLSSFDLLFTCGPGARDILAKV
jgi:hypothetical protein